MIDKKIVIIIPCYNEEKRLDTKAFENYSKEDKLFSFLFVNDGSRDETGKLIKNLSEQNENIYDLQLSENVGKAEAIRQGAIYIDEKFDYEFLGYLDADLSVPLEELDNLIKRLFNQQNISFLMGIRVQRLGAEVKRKWFRHYVGRIFASLASICLRLSVYDTQCGAKIIHQNLVEPLFKEKFLSRWLFDLELLFRIKLHAPEIITQNRILEYPLDKWTEVGQSRLKTIDFLKAPIELLKIYFFYSSKKDGLN